MTALGRPLAQVLDDAPASWRPVIDVWRRSPAGQALTAFVERRRAAGATIYPNDVLRALVWTPRPAVRVVILGQDPYHQPGQAQGLAFSVPPGQPLPPSLRNIAKELHRDLGLPLPAAGRGHLGAWARQGVLLLNSTLTVEQGRPASHAGKGWEALTDLLLAAVAEGPPTAFLLWGRHAQAKATLVGEPHLVLTSHHPSPLSATRPPTPFIGNGHFGAVNCWLRARGRPPIDWGMT